MQYTNLIWHDGQPYSEMFDDIYYSSNDGEGISGESEFNHVFLKNNGLPKRWNDTDEFVIAELGFGSGLNCILTIREWLKHLKENKQHKCLHYIALEKYPLSPAAIIELISRYPELKTYCDELIDNYPPAVQGRHRRHLFDGRVVVHYVFMDAYEALENENYNVDAWYLDGFSPAKNSDMWSEKLFEKLAQNSHQGTSCSTYTAAGFVRRNLHKAGFTVNKVTGYGKKREMLTASFNATKDKTYKYVDKPWFASPVPVKVSVKQATIIGAGIAGLSTAYSLVRRGWKVTVIDRHNDVARETSSNPAVIVYPRLSINNDVDTEFYTDAYCYNLYMLETLQKKYDEKFWFNCGVLQSTDKKRMFEIIKKFSFNEDYVSIATKLFKSNSEEGAQQVNAEYKSAGVVLPRVLCDVLKRECGEQLNLVQAKITDIKYSASRWSCMSADGQITNNEILIIANGTGVNNLGLVSNFPVESIRGQVAVFKENENSKKIINVINANKHITPSINNKHYLGATYSREGNSMEVDPVETKELFEAIDNAIPDTLVQSDYCDAWVGLRAMSKDRVPIVGAMADEVFFNKEYADIHHGNTKKTYQSARYLSGLYISAAHGSRGFTSSFLSAEIIASQVNGEPQPVSKKVMDYLSPSRFIVNYLKRG